MRNGRSRTHGTQHLQPEQHSMSRLQVYSASFCFLYSFWWSCTFLLCFLLSAVAPRVALNLFVSHISCMYGTAQYKLKVCVRMTRVCFVAPLKYFSKNFVSVDNCMRILHAIHACLTSPYMLAAIHRIFKYLKKSAIRHSLQKLTLFCSSHIDFSSSSESGPSISSCLVLHFSLVLPITK